AASAASRSRSAAKSQRRAASGRGARSPGGSFGMGSGSGYGGTDAPVRYRDSALGASAREGRVVPDDPRRAVERAGHEGQRHEGLRRRVVLRPEAEAPGGREPETGVVRRVAEDDDRPGAVAPAGGEPLAHERRADAGSLVRRVAGHRGETAGVEAGPRGLQRDGREGDVPDDLAVDHGHEAEVGPRLRPEPVHEVGLVGPPERRLVDAADGGAVLGALGADFEHRRLGATGGARRRGRPPRGGTRGGPSAAGRGRAGGASSRPAPGGTWRG